MTAYAQNRKAKFNYEILERFTAGIELLGNEVKAVIAGKISLTGAYVIIRGAEVFLTGTEIGPYQPKNTPKDYEPARARKLLLSKDEIETLEKSDKTKGLIYGHERAHNPWE